MRCRWCITPSRTRWIGASNCHRDPEDALRPLNQITNLNWKPKQEDVQAFVAKYGKPPGRRRILQGTELTQEDIGSHTADKWHINPPDKNCAGCHR